MDCVVTAGGQLDPEDPLTVYTQGKPKALLEMSGRTMLERVVDALQSSQYVDKIVVVGLGSDMGMTFQRPVHHLPDQGSIIANVIAGIDWLREQNPDLDLVLLSSADVPLLSGDIIDKFVDSCEPFDRVIYYNFVSKETMETRFPQSNRTFVKLKGIQVAGGDVLLAHASLADSHRDLWDALTNARKHAWRLAGIVGLRFLLKFLFRQVSLQDIEATAERIVGRPTRAILSPYAELAMDVDKPRQVEMLRAELENITA